MDSVTIFEEMKRKTYWAHWDGANKTDSEIATLSTIFRLCTCERRKVHTKFTFCSFEVMKQIFIAIYWAYSARFNQPICCQNSCTIWKLNWRTRIERAACVWRMSLNNVVWLCGIFSAAQRNWFKCFIRDRWHCAVLVHRAMMCASFAHFYSAMKKTPWRNVFRSTNSDANNVQYTLRELSFRCNLAK